MCCRRGPQRGRSSQDSLLNWRRMAIDVSYTDSGDARNDLTQAFVSITDQYTGVDGRIFRELLAAAVLEPEGAQLMREKFFLYRRESLLAIWQQGVCRGQLSPDVDPEDGIDLIFGAGVFRILLGQHPIGGEHSRRLAQAALGGIASHAPSGQQTH